jgi:hypothetical protein
MNTVKPVATAAAAALLLSGACTGWAGPKSDLNSVRTALATTVIAAGPPVGIEIYVQPWSPVAPDKDVPRTALMQPNGISGPMNAAWNALRSILSDPKNPNSVPALLSKGGLIAKGVTLYDVHFATNPLSAITIQPGGASGAPSANAFTMHWMIPGMHPEFHSTTPDVARNVGLGRFLDPKLSVQLDLDITLGFAVSDRPGQPALQVTQTVVHIANPQVDSGNVSGDVITSITNFCSELAYGKNLNTLLAFALGDVNIAADPQHGGFDFAGVQSVDVKKIANDQLKVASQTRTSIESRNCSVR